MARKRRIIPDRRGQFRRTCDCNINGGPVHTLRSAAAWINHQAYKAAQTLQTQNQNPAPPAPTYDSEGPEYDEEISSDEDAEDPLQPYSSRAARKHRVRNKRRVIKRLKRGGGSKSNSANEAEYSSEAGNRSDPTSPGPSPAKFPAQIASAILEDYYEPPGGGQGDSLTEWMKPEEPRILLHSDSGNQYATLSNNRISLKRHEDATQSPKHMNPRPPHDTTHWKFDTLTLQPLFPPQTYYTPASHDAHTFPPQDLAMVSTHSHHQTAGAVILTEYKATPTDSPRHSDIEPLGHTVNAPCIDPPLIKDPLKCNHIQLSGAPPDIKPTEDFNDGFDTDTMESIKDDLNTNQITQFKKPPEEDDPPTAGDEANAPPTQDQAINNEYQSEEESEHQEDPSDATPEDDSSSSSDEDGELQLDYRNIKGTPHQPKS